VTKRRAKQTSFREITQKGRKNCGWGVARCCWSDGSCGTGGLDTCRDGGTAQNKVLEREQQGNVWFSWGLARKALGGGGVGGGKGGEKTDLRGSQADGLKWEKKRGLCAEPGRAEAEIKIPHSEKFQFSKGKHEKWRKRVQEGGVGVGTGSRPR